MSWQVALGIVCLIYFYSHYLFASAAAHIGAMYTAFLSVCLACGAPAMPSALALGYLSSLMGCLTNYGIGSAPSYYGSGYVSQVRALRSRRSQVVPCSGQRSGQPAAEPEIYDRACASITPAGRLVQAGLHPLHLLPGRVARRGQRLVEGYRPLVIDSNRQACSFGAD